MIAFPSSLPAIRVAQPLGEFYVVAIKADVVKKITFVDRTRIESIDRTSFLYSLLGSQRQSSPVRARQIGRYINTVEAAFPNSIILAANYINYGELQEDAHDRWRIETGDGGTYRLVIPTNKPMASVIDGQHRLLGFDHCSDDRLGMELLCAVYMDLPQAYQAYLFATININQRKVDRSLAYEQFGYNLDDDKPECWAPDKLAVFLTRRLNLDPDSPFYEHIKIVPLDEHLSVAPPSAGSWKVSTACVVEGIMRLVSSSPKADRDTLHQLPPARRRRVILGRDSAPLRDHFLACRDDEVYTLLRGFFSECDELLWKKRNDRSYIVRTVGIQALFDVLREIGSSGEARTIVQRARSFLSACSAVDFSNPFYEASGKGRVRIKNTLLFLGGIITINELPDGDRPLYAQIRDEFAQT